ncbi:proline--tRNA ligase [Paenibacillus sp. J5C2022]|uniref:proline--tRNA ligase n=1 Tax=Paenibacillus sp. J5C2022 TaxID=2977129 RepID=UPI00397D7EA7
MSMQSAWLLRTLREVPADAETAGHQLMLRAGLIRQTAAGIYAYMPLGLRALRKLEAIVREEMERAGAQELLMPALQPAELWRQSGRYDVYGPELMMMADRHNRFFVLGPTHEEAITSVMNGVIDSYRQLPVTVFQIQVKFRDEMRPRSGLLRGREFLMKDAYSFHSDWDGLKRTYAGMYESYCRIFNRCGLNYRAVEADAGAMGGDGDNHEFIALADIGEDTIAVCNSCQFAANVEKLQEGLDEGTAEQHEACPSCEQGKLEYCKGIEVGHTFQLGDKYSSSLGATVPDAHGSERELIMGCYGIGLSRLLATIVEQHHDQRGIVWPSAVAPYQVHMTIIAVKNEAQMKLAHELYERLVEAGIETLLDDRDERAGVKLHDAELIGIPIRIVVGKHADEHRVEYSERSSETKEVVHVEKALELLLQRIQLHRTHEI